MNFVVWTVLGLYLIFILTFSIPAVQEYMGKKVADMLAAKLGTSVSIGRLDYSIPSQLTLYQVNIRDQKGRDMLFANRISARLDLLPLAEGKVSLSTAQVFSTNARLYRATADSKANYQFVLDSLASKDTTSQAPVNLRINSLIVRNARIKYDQLDAPYTPGQLNAQHLDIKDISGHLVLKVFREDSLNANIKRLSLKEQSGLNIERISMKFTGGKSNSLLQDFRLRMPGTDFQLGDIRANYRFKGRRFIDTSLTYSGSIKPSTITLADISCLLPSLKTFQGALSLEGNLHGTNSKLEIPRLTVNSTTGDINLDIAGEVSQLQQSDPTWIMAINDLALSAKTVGFISENLKGKRVEVPQEIVRLGAIHLTGVASGLGAKELQTRCQLNSDAGNVTLSFAMDEKRQFAGNIDTKGFNLRRMMNDNQFGTLATAIALSGQLPDDKPLRVQADGVVSSFVYNGYNYRNINVNALYSPTDIHGRLAIDDQNIGLNIEGTVLKERKQTNVKVTANVNGLSPKATNLSSLWEDARFSGTVVADFKASTIGDAEGTVDLTNFTMESLTDNYQLEQLHIASGYEDEVHFIRMNSDFGEAEISGDFDYHTLAQSFTNFIADKLPTLPGLPKVNPHTENDFTVQVTINKSDWLEKLLQLPVRLVKPLRLEGMVNDNTRQLALECTIPQFYYKDGRYDNARINIVSPLDKLQYDISVTKLMDDGDHLELQAVGNAADNKLETTLEWANHNDAMMRGQLAFTAMFDTLLDGKQVTHISVAPSNVLVRKALWDIRPCHITYSDKHLDINNFSISHEQQFLTLNGTASESSQDSLIVDMRDINVDYVLDLVNFHAVDFYGLATGSGSIRGIFGNFEADAKLKVRDFEFQHGQMGTLDASVQWNRELEQIDIHAIADDGPEAMTYINGYVSPTRNYIDLGIEAKGTSLEFAHSFTESFIGSLAGHGNGEVHLIGPLDHLNLTGQLVLNGRAQVSTLNCVYEMRNDTLSLTPNEMTFRNCHVYDKYGNRGILKGGIHHDELTNLTFDIFVNANNLLAYDFRHFGNSTFYGTVFAKGQVAIHGREDGVTIDAEVTPQPNSVFVYNAASPDVISDQEFIQWGSNTTQNVRQTKAFSPAEYRDDLTMNLKINATPNATIRLLMDERTNDYITLRGNGELQTTFYNKGGFNMFGTYRVTEGTYGLTIQNIIRKNFVFKEGGTIVFSGDPYNATLNMQAQHTVNGVSLSDLNVGKSFSNTVRVNCLMNITGQPSQPHVDFDFEMPNVNADEQQMVRSIVNSEEELNQQVVYLLAVGRFYPQGANNAAESETNAQSKTSLAMQSLLSGTISGQINNVLGRVIKSNNWNFGANISTGDEGWNNAEYEGIINGRLLNNRLLINGQFGYRDKATTATPSFIGDFDIRYLLYPSGNLALKVYNQTTDRYFTKSSLNTQGVGIIMKKDFNGLRDLLGIKKKKTQKEASKE
jgi:hypothetical protein